MNITADAVLEFPSVPWFEALGRRASADSLRYRRLGYCDIRLGLMVGDTGFALTISDFGDLAVSRWDGSGDAVDCSIRAAAGDWRALVEHIAANGHADPANTLNSLVLAGDRFVIEGDDQLGVDAFYRFNATIQALLDEAAGVATSYA